VAGVWAVRNTRIDAIPDHSFWSLRQSMKSDLMTDVRRRMTIQHKRNGLSDAQIDRLTQNLLPQETDILTIGLTSLESFPISE
jgi:starch phosphorylase